MNAENCVFLRPVFGIQVVTIRFLDHSRGMPMLPIPAFVALVLSYLALRAFLSEGRPFLVLFLVACALQSVLVTLVNGYNIGELRPLLPVSATMVPPLAWITFQDALVSRRQSHRFVWQIAAPVFTLFCRVFAPETIDIIVPLVFLGYGCAILLQVQNASDMPLARLEAGRVPAVLWQGLGWALVGSALCDVLITLAFLTGNDSWIGWLITLSSSLVLLLLGMLSGSPSAMSPTEEVAQTVLPPLPEDTEKEDREIVKKLEALLARDALHLDPNLTLLRLARRLQLPEKRLSRAVNRTTDSNVSRYINAWRIRHACTRIEEGASVTEAMLDSGFNTKSNFNREFLRETGLRPSQWQSTRPKTSNITHISKTS